jgi:sulfur carrier protein
VKIRLNGADREIAAGDIGGLLAEIGLPRQTALVEQNGEALARDEWDKTLLHEGDRIEVLRVAAGG